MAEFRTLDELRPRGLRVLVRADLNAPMQDGRVTDTTRIVESARTIRELAEHGARVIVLSHLGRPAGREARYSQQILVAPLAEAIGRPVAWCPETVGPAARAAVAALPPGGVLLLENTRFDPGEERNDDAFVEALAMLGEAYVNDAFSVAHRAHASTEGLARLLPAFAGRLMQAELAALERVIGAPERPVVAIVGGAKVSSKLDLLGNLVDKVQTLVIGGGMANTFLHAQGFAVGRSLCEAGKADAARAILAKAGRAGCRILLPVDVVVADRLEAGIATAIVAVGAIQAGSMALDAGPETVREVIAVLRDARTLLWNGPVGAFEVAPFDAATTAIAREAAALTRAGGLISVAGGGDTLAALAHAGVQDGMTYASTAGGAFLEWLEGRTLPGVAALADSARKAA